MQRERHFSWKILFLRLKVASKSVKCTDLIGVGVEAAEEVGDAEVGEKDEKEGDDAADVKDALGVLADA